MTNFTKIVDFIAIFAICQKIFINLRIKVKNPQQDSIFNFAFKLIMFDFLFGKRKPAPLPFHTDIHCHVLPGVDDGSPDVTTSVELVRAMAKWGITRIIATPHVTEDRFENTPDILDPALESLRKALKEADIDVELSRSSENRIDDCFFELLSKGLIRPFPNNYLLVENSFIQEPFGLDKFLFDLKVKGYKPILAHPERYIYYSSTAPERYEMLHRSGTLFQINLLSLAGYYGKRERKTAEVLINAGYVDFIGTDIHRLSHITAINNYLTTRDAARHFKMLSGRLLNDSI